MVEQERRWWTHWQNLNEDSHGNVKGRPWHGRAWLHVGNEKAHVEWNLMSRTCGVGVHFQRDSEDTITGRIAFPPVALYSGVDLHPRRRLAKLAAWIAAKSSDMGRKWSGSELSIRIFDYAVWWSVFADDSGSIGTRPKWRYGCWHPFGHNMRQGKPVVLETRTVEVPMPERTYKGTARLERNRFGWTKLPRFFDKVSTSVEIEMLPNEAVPHPGKGENSYDCGEDATFSSYAPARTIEDAIGSLVGSVLRSRRRHGGDNWRPDPKESAA